MTDILPFCIFTTLTEGPFTLLACNLLCVPPVFRTMHHSDVAFRDTDFHGSWNDFGSQNEESAHYLLLVGRASLLLCHGGGVHSSVLCNSPLMVQDHPSVTVSTYCSQGSLLIRMFC